MNVVYDCHIPQVMGYPEPGYCFLRGDNALLMWEGFFSDLMRGMWAVYGLEFDPDEPDHPHIDQVPLLREWNALGEIDGGPRSVAEVRATARAIREAVAELRRVGSNLAETPRHGEALAAFLELAAKDGQTVQVREW